MKKTKKNSVKVINSKGKFIVLYGVNNLGKTTQANLLASALRKKRIKVARIKYPIYNLGPTGPIINSVLRGRLEMSELKLQKLFAENRSEYETQLKEYLREGYSVVAEDYTGTGIAWGIVRGLPLSTLEKLNKGLFREDLAILLSGKRFLSGKEANHRNEEDDAIWKEAKRVHLKLAKKYRWRIISSNGSKLGVQRKIFKLVKKLYE